MATTFNRGHVAEYIYAIAVAAGFKTIYKNRSITDIDPKSINVNSEIFTTDLRTNYKDIKNQLSSEFTKQRKTIKENGELEYIEGKTEINIVLGEKTASKLAINSLSAFFNKKNTNEFSGLEHSALRQIEEAIKKRNFIFTEKVRKVLIKSHGVLDQKSSKADITIFVNDKIFPISLKTTSQTVHETTLSKKNIEKLTQTLFGISNIDFSGNNPEKPNDLKKIFNLIKNAATVNGKVKNKNKLIKGLIELITKKSENFMIVKLDDESYREFIFDDDFKKISNAFEYKLTVTQESPANYPYLNIKPEIENKLIKSKFATLRGKQGKKIIAELGVFMNLLSDKNFKSFLQTEVKKYKNSYVYRSDLKSIQYKGILTNLKSAGLIEQKNPILQGEKYTMLHTSIDSVIQELNIKVENLT